MTNLPNSKKEISLEPIRAEKNKTHFVEKKDEISSAFNYFTGHLLKYNYEQINETNNLLDKYFKKKGYWKIYEDLKNGRVNQEDLTYEELLYVKKITVDKYKSYYFMMYFGIRKMTRFLFGNYIFNKKESFEEYNYSKSVKITAVKILLKSMIANLFYTFLFFVWMRTLKHKSSKDKMVIFQFAFIASFATMNHYSYSFFVNTPIPLSKNDFEKRLNLIDCFVLQGNKSFILSEEIKHLSKLLDSEQEVKVKIITPTSKAGLELITWKGKLYMNSDNYLNLFGYKNSEAAKRGSIQVLNCYNTYEYEILIALYKLYFELYKMYKKKNGIENENEELNMKEKYIKELIQSGNIKRSDLQMMEKLNNLKSQKNSENIFNMKEYSEFKDLVEDIDYSKILKFFDENEKNKNNMNNDVIISALKNKDKIKI